MNSASSLDDVAANLVKRLLAAQRYVYLKRLAVGLHAQRRGYSLAEQVGAKGHRRRSPPGGHGGNPPKRDTTLPYAPPCPPGGLHSGDTWEFRPAGSETGTYTRQLHQAM